MNSCETSRESNHNIYILENTFIILELILHLKFTFTLEMFAMIRTKNLGAKEENKRKQREKAQNKKKICMSLTKLSFRFSKQRRKQKKTKKNSLDFPMWKLKHIEICTKDLAGDMEEWEKKAEKFSDWRKDSRTPRKHSRRKETSRKDSPQNKKVLAHFFTQSATQFKPVLAKSMWT